MCFAENAIGKMRTWKFLTHPVRVHQLDMFSALLRVIMVLTNLTSCASAPTGRRFILEEPHLLEFDVADARNDLPFNSARTTVGGWGKRRSFTCVLGHFVPDFDLGSPHDASPMAGVAAAPTDADLTSDDGNDFAAAQEPSAEATGAAAAFDVVVEPDIYTEVEEEEDDDFDVDGVEAFPEDSDAAGTQPDFACDTAQAHSTDALNEVFGDMLGAPAPAIDAAELAEELREDHCSDDDGIEFEYETDEERRAARDRTLLYEMTAALARMRVDVGDFTVHTFDVPEVDDSVHDTDDA